MGSGLAIKMKNLSPHDYQDSIWIKFDCLVSYSSFQSLNPQFQLTSNFSLAISGKKGLEEGRKWKLKLQALPLKKVV